MLKPGAHINTALQLLLPVAIYFAVTSGAHWGWWLFSAVTYLVGYAMLANNIVMHRYFTHRHFEISRPVEWLFIMISAACGLGSPASYAGVHITHHVHSDTDKDPHGPGAGIKSWLFCFHRHHAVKETISRNRHVLYLYGRYRRLHDYYLVWMLAVAVVLYLISPTLFLFGWFLPVCLCQWGVAIGVYFQHYDGKINNFYYSLVGLGDELHQHHHDDSRLTNHAINSGELDFTYQLSRIFAKKYNDENPA